MSRPRITPERVAELTRLCEMHDGSMRLSGDSSAVQFALVAIEALPDLLADLADARAALDAARETLRMDARNETVEKAIVRHIRASRRAFEVLGSQEKAVRWMITENRALGGKMPCVSLDTDEGADRVLAVLARIEHGVHS